MTGGHARWIGREADGADEVRKAVREQLRAGADCIKFIATGGVMTPDVEPGAQQLTLEELTAGIEEAHKAGRTTAAHAHGADGIKAAVLAGIDSIEHGSFMTDECMALMRERGTFYSATLCSAEGFYDAPPGSVADWALAKGMRVRAALDDDSPTRRTTSGVKLVLGTDAGTPFNRHGDNARELALMVRVGVDPVDALRAGTRNAAELLGKLDVLGTIEPGKLADLVLCAGDVVADPGRLRATETIRAVVQNGHIVHRAVSRARRARSRAAPRAGGRWAAPASARRAPCAAPAARVWPWATSTAQAISGPRPTPCSQCRNARPPVGDVLEHPVDAAFHLLVGEAVPIERRQVQEVDASLSERSAVVTRLQPTVDDGRDTALLQVFDLAAPKCAADR